MLSASMHISSLRCARAIRKHQVIIVDTHCALVLLLLSCTSVCSTFFFTVGKRMTSLLNACPYIHSILKIYRNCVPDRYMLKVAQILRTITNSLSNVVGLQRFKL